MEIKGFKTRREDNLWENTTQKNKVAKSSFLSIEQQQSQQHYATSLGRILDLIDHQGRLLKRSRSYQDFLAYKKQIKSFLQITIKAHQSKQFSVIGFDGAMKLYTVVEKVDQALADLAAKILAQETENLSIAADIEEIRGLLFDFFA